MTDRKSRANWIALIVVAACALMLSPPVSAQDGIGRVVLIAKALKVLPDGRATVTLLSGDTITVKPKDLDLKMMQALVRQTDTPQSAAAPEVEVKMLPTHDVAMPGIKSKCAKEWPTDFSMQQHCQTQQREALSALWARDMLGSSDGRMIRSKCQGEWPEDFSMRNYCEDQQMKARAAIK